MLRMNKYFVDPVVEEAKVTDIQIMQEDLDRISNQIDDSVSRGSCFNRETFGCERSDLFSWRCLVNEKRTILQHICDEDRKAKAARIKLNTQDKEINWPNVISSETWPDFLQLWNKEKDYMGSEYFRCRHLISHMAPADKFLFQNHEDSAQIIAGLMMLFGSLEEMLQARWLSSFNLINPKNKTNI